MMTRRQRLMATLRGEPVDRPPVSFYEIGGWTLNPDDPDPFNIYNGPGWRDLIQLAEDETDLIRMMSPIQRNAPVTISPDLLRIDITNQEGARFTRKTIIAGGRTLTSLDRRDAHIATTWTLEPLLKDKDDLIAYMHLPEAYFRYHVDVSPLLAEEQSLGERGVVMVDVADPLCIAASLFSLETFMVLAYTERELFHQLLELHAQHLYPFIQEASKAFPGRLWRVVGSEYASEPLLPPALYHEYEVRYTQPIIDIIQNDGGFARLHSHGRLKHILPHISAMKPAGLDPVEPPPQGDMHLIDVRLQYGDDMVLFGNIEASELELMQPSDFEQRVMQALKEGTAGAGRGFVLMPSSCPYGREILPHVTRNYETMVRAVQRF